MNRFMKTCGFAMLLAALVAPQALWAQSSQSTGQIVGSVQDSDGAALPGVAVEAKNAETGFSRVAITDGSGFFRLDMLPSAVYDVKANLSGFRTETQRGVRVSLGSSVQVEYTLAPSAIEEEIVVTAMAPVIETSNPSVAATIGEESIQNLPLQGRDFTDFAILAPGTAGADGSQNSNRGGLHMGARAIQNSFNIDGSNSQSSFFGEERGGTRPPFTFSQAAIKEFQVVKSSYNLQFNSSGGVLNAITKSGTNEVHGQVFAYYQDDSFRSDDPRGYATQTYEQSQYGFAIGGPVVKDKLHYFGSYDGQKFTTPLYVNFQDFPEDRTAEWEALTGLNYANETSNIDQTNDADVMMIKFDWQAANNHLLTVRDNYSQQKGLNLTSSYSNTGRSNNGIEENNFNSLVASLNSVLSDDMFNELIVQYSAEQRPRGANDTTHQETGIYRYRAAWGQNNFLPNSLDEDRIQIIDNFTYYLGAHTLKAGINIENVSFTNVFYRYHAGAYSYSEWDDFFVDEPYSYTQSFSDYEGKIDFDVDYYALYLQDEWRVNSGLTLTYGLRYDLQKNPTPEVCNPAYPDTCQIPDDSNNIAPRIGFAWDVAGDGKSVLRGGIGMYYDNTPTLLLSNAMNDNGVRTLTINATCSYGDCPAYGTLWDSAEGLYASTPSIKVMDPNFENSETWRLSLGYEREILTDLSVGVDVIYSETSKLERSLDRNLGPGEGLTADGLPTYETQAYYDDFDEINQYTSDVDAEYTAIILKANKRYSNGWMLNASYTYSDAQDSNSNERSTTSYPWDQHNLDLSWGPSDFDTTHKFVLSGSYLAPWDILISGIIYARSGYPYTAYGNHDTNHDGQYSEPALPSVVDGYDGPDTRYDRNSFNQPTYSTVDLRLSKTFNFGNGLGFEILLDIFNVFDEENWYTSRTELVGYSSSSRENFIRDNFGELNEVAGDPRTFQIGAKFLF